MLYPLSFTLTTRIISINCTKLTYQHRLTLTLEKEQSHTNDIKAFIETQLKFDEDIEPAELTRLRDRVLNKSSGIFLWVNLAVLQLNEVFDRCGQMNAVWERLEEIPRAAKEAQAPNRERALYGLFQDVIQKDNRNIPELIRLAQIVFCAKRPLNSQEFYVVLVQSYGLPFGSLGVSDQALTKKVREASKGLAEVTESKEPTVQFIHETVREFIRDGGLVVLTEQPVHTEGYEIMKLSCLGQIQAPVADYIDILSNYRTRKNFRRGDKRDKATKKSEHYEFVRQAKEKFPFLEYATRNIFFHADEAESKGITQSGFLEEFPLVEWISVYNLLQEFSTRRFQGLKTPMLYILAHQGCNNLIKNPTASRENYALSTKGEEFPFALICAIYSGHQNTAWTLAALDTRHGPKEENSQAKAEFRVKNGLLGMLLRIGDTHLLRKVIQDGHCANIDIQSSASIFADASSEEIAAILAEYAVRRGSLAEISSYPQVVETGAPYHTSLPSINKAIERNPDLLQVKIWGGKSMIDYATDKNFQSLVSVYLEKSENRQSAVDKYLRSAICAENIAMVKHALHCGANPGSQDESGRTAMHIVSEKMKDNSYVSPYFQILELVFTEGIAYIGITDNRGQTSKLALWSALVFYAFSSPCFLRKRWDCLIRTLLSIKADFSDLMPCRWCSSKPHHEVPFPTVLILDRCDDRMIRDFAVHGQWDCLDCRDTLGRTPLSWCFSSGHGNQQALGDTRFRLGCLAANGKFLLKQSSIDVNSRDNAGCTILEHFVRHPWYSNERDLDAFVREFFQSQKLDLNLPTSTGETPLEFIISLYDTWPAEFGDFKDRSFCGYDPEKREEIWSAGEDRQQWFSKHLLKAGKLILGTGKVDHTTQVRCASCEQTPPALRSMIEASLESQFPGRCQEAEILRTYPC